MKTRLTCFLEIGCNTLLLFAGGQRIALNMTSFYEASEHPIETLVSCAEFIRNRALLSENGSDG